MQPNGYRLRSLHQPKLIHGAADAKGKPTMLVINGQRKQVASIEDRWRIDDEWWRKEISRMYFDVILEDGQRLTVFHDLIADAWYLQTTATPTAHSRPVDVLDQLHSDRMPADQVAPPAKRFTST
jgi:hypothetical protein